MGGPMARNLISAGHSLKVFDLSEEAVNFGSVRRARGLGAGYGQGR